MCLMVLWCCCLRLSREGQLLCVHYETTITHLNWTNNCNSDFIYLGRPPPCRTYVWETLNHITLYYIISHYITYHSQCLVASLAMLAARLSVHHWLKYLNSFWMDCHEIWFRQSRSPEDDSYFGDPHSSHSHQHHVGVLGRVNRKYNVAMESVS